MVFSALTASHIHSACAYSALTLYRGMVVIVSTYSWS